MTPLLTDEEVKLTVQHHGTGGWQTAADMETFARAIEQAVMRKAYQRAAEVCAGLPSIVNGYHRTVTGDVCRDAIRKLMEE